MAWPKGKPRSKTNLAVVEREPVDARAMWDQSRFNPVDFACKCGNYCMVDIPILPELLTNLGKMADKLDFPMHILDGVRCSQRHLAVNESHGDGHMVQPDGFFYGVDISCSDFTRHEILKLALPLFPRVGVNETFIHVDMLTNTPKLCWVYGLDER